MTTDQEEDCSHQVLAWFLLLGHSQIKNNLCFHWAKMEAWQCNLWCETRSARLVLAKSAVYSWEWVVFMKSSDLSWAWYEPRLVPALQLLGVWPVLASAEASWGNAENWLRNFFGATRHFPDSIRIEFGEKIVSAKITFSDSTTANLFYIIIVWYFQPLVTLHRFNE